MRINNARKIRAQAFTFCGVINLLLSISFGAAIKTLSNNVFRKNDIILHATSATSNVTSNTKVNGIAHINIPTTADMFNMKTYFQNLFTYQSHNNVGSCGLVALISILSFYDTFYNDDIIPEQYDRHFSDSKTYEEAISNSPGVEFNVFEVKHEEDKYEISCESGHKTNYQFCVETQDTDFHSKLCLLLKELGDPLWYSFQWVNTGRELLDALYGKDKVNFTFFKDDQLSQAEYKSEIRNEISKGHPVLVGFLNANNKYGHGVVAYDYDNENIFSNFGFNARDGSHVPLLKNVLIGNETYAYEGGKICGIAKLDFSNFNHKHSNNYIINHEKYCGCGYHFENPIYNLDKIVQKINSTEILKRI